MRPFWLRATPPPVYMGWMVLLGSNVVLIVVLCAIITTQIRVLIQLLGVAKVVGHCKLFFEHRLRRFPPAGGPLLRRTSRNYCLGDQSTWVLEPPFDM